MPELHESPELASANELDEAAPSPAHPADTELEELAFSPLEELAEIEGFDETVAAELVRRAETFLSRRDTELTEQRQALGVSEEIAAIETLTPAMLVALGEKGIKTLDDLADLATDELIQKRRVEPRRKTVQSDEPKGGILADYALTEEQGNEIIMAARAHWFEDEVVSEGDADAVPSQ